MTSFAHLYEKGHSLADPLLESVKYPYEALPLLHEFLLSLFERMDLSDYREVAPNAYAHKSVRIPSFTTILGPALIGEGTEVRPGAYIRGDALIGKGCVVGHDTEIKNAILFDGVEVCHFNYVGDSVLGYKSHLGAGAITSNFKIDHSSVVIHALEGDLATGLPKMGSLIGDHAEIGANTVLNPGTVIGEYSRVYPGLAVRGEMPPYSILKEAGVLVPILGIHPEK